MTEKMINPKIDPELGSRLEMIARSRKTTQTEVVRTAIRTYVENEYQNAEFKRMALEMLERDRAALEAS